MYGRPKGYISNRSFYRLPIISLLMLSPLSYAVAGQGAAVDTGRKKAYGKVLVVSNADKKNDPVIVKVVQMLRKEGNYVKLGIGTNLKGMKPGRYGAIIVINFVEARAKDRKLEIFADESVQKRIVLLNLVGDYLSSVKGQPDSKAVRSEEIAFNVVERTKAVLLKYGGPQTGIYP